MCSMSDAPENPTSEIPAADDAAGIPPTTTPAEAAPPSASGQGRFRTIGIPVISAVVALLIGLGIGWGLLGDDGHDGRDDRRGSQMQDRGGSQQGGRGQMDKGGSQQGGRGQMDNGGQMPQMPQAPGGQTTPGASQTPGA